MEHTMIAADYPQDSNVGATLMKALLLGWFVVIECF